MAWTRNLQIVAWVCFVLMWIPLAVFILHDSSQPATDNDLLTMEIFLALLFGFIILLVISHLGPLIIDWRESRLVRAQGTLVPAVITVVSDTGIYINEQPVLEMAITVHPPHEAAFDAKVRKVIPFSSIPQVQPGAKLEVYYIPGTTRVAMPE
jgi:hypothetical protein